MMTASFMKELKSRHGNSNSCSHDLTQNILLQLFFNLKAFLSWKMQLSSIFEIFKIKKFKSLKPLGCKMHSSPLSENVYHIVKLKTQKGLTDFYFLSKDFLKILTSKFFRSNGEKRGGDEQCPSFLASLNPRSI